MLIYLITSIILYKPMLWPYDSHLPTFNLKHLDTLLSKFQFNPNLDSKLISSAKKGNRCLFQTLINMTCDGNLLFCSCCCCIEKSLHVEEEF